MDNVTDILANKFIKDQGIDEAAAIAVAEKILGADEDIAEAARSWAENGLMPEAPTVEGHTPASLADKFQATQIFTILIALRKDPARAETLLRRFESDINRQG